MKQLKELEAHRELREASPEPWEKLLASTKDNVGAANRLLQAHEGVSHFAAKTLDEASYLLQVHEKTGAKVISGGTDILRMTQQKYLPELPGVLVDIKATPNLAYIKEETGALRIGALTCLSDIATSELIRTKYSILADAASVIGSPQIRNMATVAGSICQDIGCWYYRADKNYYHCLRKGGADCPAKEGDNRWMFSIFGAPKECKCYATCQSDMAIALSALSTYVKTTQRTIPIEEFYIPIPPGNVLRPDEIIEEIQIPILSPDTKAKYSKFSIRKSLDHPLISVACVASGKDIKIVLGGVFIMPYRVKEAEDIIKNKKNIDHDSADRAGEIALRHAAPMSMNAWKVEVAKTLIRRTVLALT